jgi:hypothetical protein
MALIGSASVEIRAVDRFFERDVRAAVKKIKNVEIELKADVDMTKVNKKLADLRYRLRNNIVQMNIQAPVDEIREKLDDVITDYHNQRITLNANVDTGLANAQLAATARPRTATIHTKVDSKIDPEVQKALKGLFYTITGSIPMDKVRDALLGLAGNFEMITIKGAAVTSVISALAGSITSLTGSALTLGRDLADVVGLIGVLPAGMFMAGTAIAATTLAWKGFSDAFDQDAKKAAKAMAKLPVEAQNAVKSLKGVGEAIRKTTQKAYWVEMAGAIESLHDSVIPQLQIGLEGTGKAMGKMTRAVIDGLWELGANGSFELMFEKGNKALENMERGVQPVVTAMGKLGAIGSTFLPRFGDWVADLGVKFGDWIEQMDDAKIATWIEDGITTVKELGSVVKSTTGIFSGLTDAATRAGYGGLGAFADGLSKASDVVNREPFKSQMVMIFSAAGDAAGILSGAVGNLLKTLGSASEVLGGFFRVGSGVIGAFLDNISAMLEHSDFLAGLYTGVADFKTSIDGMEPGFIHLGNIIGNLAKLAGTVFQAMAPGFNSIMDTLDGVIASVTPGLQAVVPVFNEFVQSVLSIAQGPIQALAAGVGAFATAFANLPGWVQTVAMSLGAIALLRPALTGMFGGMAGGLATARARMAGDFGAIDTGTQTISKSAQNMWGHFGAANTHLGSFSSAIRNIPFATATSGFGGMGTAISGAASSLGKAGGRGLMGALSGGMAMLGGPWGLAIAGGVAALSAFGAAQEESKARVEGLSQTLDQQTGHISNATKNLMAKNSLDGVTDGWDDFFRGVLQGSKSTEEALSTLGISTKQYTDKLSDPSGRDAYVKGMDAISDAMRDGRPITDQMAAAIGTTKEQLQGVNGNTMRHLADKAGNAADELTKAEEKTRKLAEATGLTDARAAILAKNFETLASATSSASDKFGALKSNLDLLNGNMMSGAQTRKEFAQSMADSKKALEDLTKGGEVSLNNLYKVGDGFDFASQSGRDFHTTLGTATDAILKNGTAALDQAIKSGKSSADANSAAIQAMQPGIQALRDNLSKLGVDQPKIDDIIRSFGLMPDQIATAVSVEGTEEAQRKIIMTKVVADSFANGNYKAVLAALPESAKAAIAEVTGKGKEFAAGDYESVLKAFDGTAGGREAALANILGVTNGNYNAALQAWDKTQPGTTAARNSILKVTAGENYEASIKAFDATGAGNTKAIESIHAVVNGKYEAALTALNVTQPGAAAALQSILAVKDGDYTAEIEAFNKTAPGNEAALRAILSVVDPKYTAILDAWDKTQPAVSSAKTNIGGVEGKTVTIKAEDQATGTIDFIKRTINGIDRYVKVTVDTVYNNYAGKAGNAVNPDGNGANGGVLSSVSNKSSLFRGNFPLHRYANGGFENHVAQFAKPGAMRLWAEPETGGEAYIPLAKRKRVRSLKILEEVARIFGFGLFPKSNMFADGGIEQAVKTQVVQSPSAGGPNVEFNVYPSAGLDEEQTGRYAMNELYWQLTNK